MEYHASLDTLCKIITAIVIVLFAAIGLFSLRALFYAQGDLAAVFIHSGLLLLLITILLVSYLYAPKSYVVDKEALIINRPVGKVKIKLEDIAEARTTADGEMNGAIRTFGNGGLFGYYGKFYVPKTGSITFYATQRKNMILITTGQGKKILITPDDQGILEHLPRH